MKISCVLITQKEEYPKIIMERLNLGFFDEIIVKHGNNGCYERYLGALEARNETIYVQDDDCMVNYQNLFKKYDGRITNAMTIPFKNQYDTLGCTLVGWGCYFPKQMIKSFDKYIQKYGVDAHLLREADRIFTYLNKPFNTVIMPHEDVDANASDRMSAPDKLDEHFKSRDEALEKCRVLL